MLTLTPFIQKFNFNTTNNRQNTSSVPRYTNLAPLARDTVSFGRSDKDMEKLSNGVNLKTAKKVNIEAQESGKYLKRQLDDILGDLVRPDSGTGSLSKPIEKIMYRIKTPKSIREKSATRKWYSAAEVKANMTDIVGARVVMANASQDNVNKVIDKLTEAEANNKLKILEIENFRPEPEIDGHGNVVKSYDYASPAALRRLKSECDKKGTMISKRDEDVPTGYMAIHLLTQLPNGFTGEIQIMGTDVEDLKDIEDVCYKIKSGKHLDKKYSSVEKMLSPLADKDDVMLRREYNNYTRSAYIYQRDKEPIKSKNKEKTPFLNIPDYLPLELDFNNIKSKINHCDIKAKKEEKDQ